VDIGTSGAKALLCDASGRIIATATREYPLLQPRVGWTEQDPESWWDGACGAIRDVLAKSGIAPESIAGIGLSGQMHGSVLLGADAIGRPGAGALRPALLWNDQRTGEACEQIERAAGGRAALVDMVGNAALPGFTLPKLLWVRQHEPDVFSKARVLMMPKDYILYRLTGRLGTDVGDASGTLLFDVDRRTWSSRMFALADVDPGLLPPALESPTVGGHLDEGGASATGLRPGTPVAAGSGDNMCAAIGAGVVEPGVALAVLGTSGVIYAHAPGPRKDLPTASEPARPAGRVHTMCAGSGRDGWCVTGCTLSAGGALRWARETVAPGVGYEQLMREAAAAPPGCDGLFFLPQLTGERCPYPDPKARGGWVGLSARHTRGHLLRAVVEGVSFTMATILDLMRSIGVQTQTVRLSGGGNRSDFWRQMQADLYRVPVVTTNADEGGSAMGAALLGGVAAGVFRSVPEACGATIQVRETREPDGNATATYGPFHRVHGNLYHALREQFAEIARL
jgi:xylulokinase